MANYQVTINPDSDFANGEVLQLVVDGVNTNGDPMDQQSFWFRMYAPTFPIGKNYSISINPDIDFNPAEIVKLQIGANNDLGAIMDLLLCWFKALEPVPITGNSYHVSIDPDTDFSSGQIAYLQIEGNNILTSPMDVYLSWFRMLDAFPGYQIVINPDVDFEEMNRIDMEVSAVNIELLSLLSALWFETGHVDVVVNILPGYPDVGIISKTPGFDTAIIRWEVNKKAGAYQIELGGTGKDTGVILGTVFGSQNVQGNLSGILAPIDTIINGSDLEAASPNSGAKRINIYVTDQWGYTNAYEG